MQTVLTCSKLISPQAMSQVIRFLYTGRIESQIINMGAIKQVREENIRSRDSNGISELPLIQLSLTFKISCIRGSSNIPLLSLISSNYNLPLCSRQQSIWSWQISVSTLEISSTRNSTSTNNKKNRIFW